jgi:hypothetical protein
VIVLRVVDVPFEAVVVARTRGPERRGERRKRRVASIALPAGDPMSEAMAKCV